MRLTVGQAGPLLGVSNPKLELEARFVIARERGRDDRHIRAQEDCAPVAWRVHHDHATEVALALPMVEALVVAHERVVFGLNFCNPRAVAPAHLAIVGLGTSGTGPFGPWSR